MKIDYAVSDDDVDSGNIRFMPIFAVVLKIYVSFPDFMPTPVYYVGAYTRISRFFVIKFNSFAYLRIFAPRSYLPIRLRRFVKCGLAEIWQAD